MELPSRGRSSPVRSDPVTDHQLLNVADHITGVATRAWAEVVGDGQVPDTAIVAGPDPASVVARARVATALGSRSALVALAALLTAEGWAVSHGVGAARTLTARRLDAVELTASYDERRGCLELVTSSATLPVGAVRAGRLLTR